jgi:hypothetical protein
MLELPANGLLAIRPGCSEKRHRPPCRPPHERKLGDQTRDDADKEPREERSCGRSQTSLYNRERPHQALGFATPAELYRPSKRSFPDSPPTPQYAPGEIVRRVGTTKAYVSFRNRIWKVPEAFRGETLAIRPRLPDGCFAICFGAHQIASIDLNSPERFEIV